MRKMSLEERKKWYEDRIEKIYLKNCYFWHEYDILIFKQGLVSKLDESDTMAKLRDESTIGCINSTLQAEPYIEQFLHKQEWLGCNLAELHFEIEDNDFESFVICLIKDAKIIKKYSKKGYTSFVEAIDFSTVINDAKKMKADGIYNVHNHPCKISAYPSKLDIKNMSREKSEAEKAGFKYNWGVISCEDYWDYEQYGKTNIEISEMIDEVGSIKRKAEKELEAEGKYFSLSHLEILQKIKEVAEKQ